MSLFEIKKVLYVHIGLSQLSCRLKNGNDQIVFDCDAGHYDFIDRCEKLKSDLDNLIEQADKKYRFHSVIVLISDPLVKNLVMDKSSLPGKKSSQIKLMKARIEKEFQMNSDEYVLSIQDFVPKKKIAAFILSSELYELIDSVIRSRKKILREVALSYKYISNRIDKYLSKKPGVVLFMEETYWTIGVYNESRQLEYLRSKWTQNDLEKDMESIALSLTSFSRSSDSADYQTAYYIGNSEYEEKFCGYLKELTSENVVSLNKKFGINELSGSIPGNLIHKVIYTY